MAPVTRPAGGRRPRSSLANWITLARFPLLPVILLLLTLGNSAVRMAGAALLFVALMLDTVDGVVARRRGETSLLGSVLDIAADRAYELTLWIWFATLGMVPVVIPLIVVVRTALTDAFRGVGVRAGTAPLAQHRTALGRFLVGSSWMRTGYAATKIVTFCGLAVVLAIPEAAGIESATGMLRPIAWMAAGLCVLRGVPVTVHGLRELATPA